MAETNVGDQTAQRTAKVQACRSAGKNPYPNAFSVPHCAAEIRRLWGEKTREELEAALAKAPEYVVAGRVMSWRSFGKVTFFDLRDSTGTIQAFLQPAGPGKAGIEPERLSEIKKAFDIGDIVRVAGAPFKTKTGELTLLCTSADPVTKCLHPLPEKWHGLTDVELRYRQRYLDLAVNPESKAVFEKRSRIIRFVRAFLDARGYVEVETPMMQPIATGANARPFVTHHNALDMDLYMRIAPELYLKRLLVGGFDRVYELNRSFRNEGISTQHNPEFTMLEFYQAYATYEDLMALTEEMISTLAIEVCASTRVTWQGTEIDLTPPWRRMTVREGLLEAGLTPSQVDDAAALRTAALERGIDLSGAERAGHLQMALFEHHFEPLLVQPTFVTDFPLDVSPLSRKKDSDPSLADRFELYITGREIANAFSELNDPADQRSRFEAQAEAKARGYDEAMPYDADYIRALEFGMPPAAGEGIGIDRLTMLLTDSPSIRDVILFPLLKTDTQGT
ncbi:MAG: lysine--tRNA ligase [Deltaproteobacteria bacterium]|nr:lysine--tRNA ligase [Deltaproteobacteria bacterium]